MGAQLVITWKKSRACPAPMFGRELATAPGTAACLPACLPHCLQQRENGLHICAHKHPLIHSSPTSAPRRRHLACPPDRWALA
jgi:hypothetical protein